MFFFCPFVTVSTIVFVVVFFIFLKVLHVDFKTVCCQRISYEKEDAPINVQEGDQYVKFTVSRPSVVCSEK